MHRRTASTRAPRSPRPGLHARTPGPVVPGAASNEARGRAPPDNETLTKPERDVLIVWMPDPDGGVTVRHGDGGAVQ